MCELHNQQAFSSHYHTKMAEEESYPQHPVYEKNTIEFVTVAAEYCAFIENCGVYTSKAFFETCVKLASLLYLKSALLPEMDENGFSDLQQYVTENTYMDIQEAIKQKTAQFDEYLDVVNEDSQYNDTTIAYISEDLADVYQDLKDAIVNFQSADLQIMNDALRECRDNFQDYWGQKLLNALRSMHSALYSSTEWDDEYDDPNINSEEVDFFND